MLTCRLHLTVNNMRAATAAGKLLEAVQESPAIMCFPSDPDKFSLGFSWHMQTPLNCLPDDAAVFFELQHYKLAKKKVRLHHAAVMTRCLSGLGRPEVPGSQQHSVTLLAAAGGCATGIMHASGVADSNATSGLTSCCVPATSQAAFCAARSSAAEKHQMLQLPRGCGARGCRRRCA